MAESSWPSPSNGRTVSDLQYEKIGIGTGPVAGVITGLASPTLISGDSSGRQVKVAADTYAVVGGHIWWSGSSIVTQAIAANVSGSTRIDLVVLRLSRTTWDVNLTVIAGTPGSGAPAAVQNTGTTGSFDLPLATVTVASGASTISAANVAYVAAHLGPDGVYRAPAGPAGATYAAALAYIPLKYAGMRALMTDGTTWQYVNSLWLPDQAICVVRHSGTPAITIPTAGGVMTYDTDINDLPGWHNPASNPTRFTPTVHGMYQIVAAMHYPTNSTGRRSTAIRVNNGILLYGNVIGAVGGNVGTQVVLDIELLATDYFEVYAFQDSGGGLGIGDYNSSRTSLKLLSVMP